jgi:hypothetical protein
MKRKLKPYLIQGFGFFYFLKIYKNLLILGSFVSKVDNFIKTVDKSGITVDKLAKTVDRLKRRNA